MQQIDSNRMQIDPKVLIYDPKKPNLKILNHKHLGIGKQVEIVEIVLSEKKYCLTLTRVNNNTMFVNYYDYVNEILIASRQVSNDVKRIAFDTTSDYCFSACGRHYLRCFVLEGDIIKESSQIKRSDEHTTNFVDAKYLPNGILLAISSHCIGYFVMDNIVRYKLYLEHSDQILRNIDEMATSHKVNLSTTELSISDPFPNDPNQPTPQCLAVVSNHFAVGWKHKPMVG